MMGYGALYLSHKIVDYLAPNLSYVALVEIIIVEITFQTFSVDGKEFLIPPFPYREGG